MEEESTDYEESINYPVHARLRMSKHTGWIILYMTGKTANSLDQWLQQYPPSVINRADDVSWIAVYNYLKKKDDNNDDLKGLVSHWEKHEEAGRPVNFDTLRQMACDFHITSGKWIIFASTGGKIDHIWSIIARGVVNGTLPSRSAKVSPLEIRDNICNNHCICVYNNDFTNSDQVHELEQAIRKSGIRCKMIYKPDVYTHLGVYSGNQWGMKPYIYQSMYDVRKGESVITSLLSMT